MILNTPEGINLYYFHSTNSNEAGPSKIYYPDINVLLFALVARHSNLIRLNYDQNIPCFDK